MTKMTNTKYKNANPKMTAVNIPKLFDTPVSNPVMRELPSGSVTAAANFKLKPNTVMFKTNGNTVANNSTIANKPTEFLTRMLPAMTRLNPSDK